MFILIVKVWNLYIAIAIAPIFTVLMLFIKEHGRFFNIFCVLFSFSTKSCQIDFSVLFISTSRYFMLLIPVLKYEVSLISPSASLSFVYRRGIYFYVYLVFLWYCILPHHWLHLSSLGVISNLFCVYWCMPSYHLQIIKFLLFPYLF